MKTFKLILRITVVGFALAFFIGVAYFERQHYLQQKKKIDLLKETLADSEHLLAKTEVELDYIKRKGDLLSTNNAALTEQLKQSKNKLSEVEANKAYLQREVSALFGEKQKLKKDLEAQLATLLDAHEQQLSAKEKEFAEKLKGQQKAFLIQKDALATQIQATEAVLEQLDSKNKELLKHLSEKEKEIEKLFQTDELARQLRRLEGDLTQQQEQLMEIVKEKVIINAQLDKNYEQSSQLKDKLAKTQEDLKEQTLRFHYNLAHLYDESRRYKEALAEYKKALKVDPDDAHVHYNLAVLYDEHLRDKKKAIEHYQRYLELNPSAEDAEKVAYWIKKAEEELAPFKTGLGALLPNTKK